MPIDQLTEADLPALHRLAQACLAVDGGLPLLAETRMLRSRLLREQTVAIREDGALLAAAGLDVDGDRATTSGLVAPHVRRRGLGTHLLTWAEDEAGQAALTVATESCGPDAERLYARHGLVCTFAESVRRHDLQALPSVGPPVGVTVVPVSEADPADLYAAYVGSFADRPGFVRPEAVVWLAELDLDPDWRRDLSLLVSWRGTPVGFVNVIGRWVDQVGVVPEWRGRRLASHLVARTLRALAVESPAPVWLCVNVDNPAGELYRRLGFAEAGTRARFTRPAVRRA
jgi:GNAT superfamily N-acetyltransferase